MYSSAANSAAGGEERNYCGGRIGRSKSIPFLTRDWSDDGFRQRAAALILAGMEHCWFTVGMLMFEQGDFPTPGRTGDQDAPFYLEMLTRFVNWLPEICELSDRFTTEAWTVEEFGSMMPYCVWTKGISVAAVLAGYQFVIPASSDELRRSSRRATMERYAGGWSTAE